MDKTDAEFCAQQLRRLDHDDEDGRGDDHARGEPHRGENLARDAQFAAEHVDVESDALLEVATGHAYMRERVEFGRAQLLFNLRGGS